MRPEDVNPEWVEAALNTRLPSGGLPTLNEPQMRAILAAVLPKATANEPHLIEWAVEVDAIGTKEIYDTEDGARAAADKDDLRLFRIEWMEVEK